MDSHAWAGSFDQDVTSKVIMGTGIGNGEWTVDRDNGVELGLRAKLAFNGLGASNRDGSYSFQPGERSVGLATRNFEWSINSDYDGSSAYMLEDLTYVLTIDRDPTSGLDLLSSDPINLASLPYNDNSFGTNATSQSGGAEATSRSEYETLIASSNLGQNSWNLGFTGLATSFDPYAAGVYEFSLSAYDGNTLLASTTMRVGVAPEPGTFFLLGVGVVGLVVVRRRCRLA